MRLINYGPGEACDRLTILSLKILFGEDAGKPVQHFKNEQAVLLTQMRAKTINGWFGAVLDLAAINSTLWHAEDVMRAYREAIAPATGDIRDLAFRIQELNDRRAELVQQINQQAGEVVLGREKILA